MVLIFLNQWCFSIIFIKALSPYKASLSLLRVSQVALILKNPPANVGDIRDTGSIPGLGRFPSRKARQHTPVFLPGEFHGHRSLMGYSPWGRKELDTTEPLTFTLSSLSYFLGALYDVYHHIWCIPSCANHSIKSRFDSYKQYTHTHSHQCTHSHCVWH